MPYLADKKSARLLHLLHHGPPSFHLFSSVNARDIGITMHTRDSFGGQQVSSNASIHKVVASLYWFEGSERLHV